MKKIKPLADRLIIKVDDTSALYTNAFSGPLNLTAGGIAIPEILNGDLTNKYSFGTVVEVGEGRTTPEGVVVPIEMVPGDRVVYSKFSGTKLKDQYIDHLLLKEVDILAILEEVNVESI